MRMRMQIFNVQSKTDRKPEASLVYCMNQTKRCNGKKTRRIAIANRTCVSFCNQPKAQFGYLKGVTPVYHCIHRLCRWRHKATSRKSKTYFGLPWVRSWDNRSKCHMDDKRIQCLTNASQHVPINLQPFPSNSTRKFKRSPF